MTDHLTSPEDGGGRGIRSSFDDESPFLDEHRTFEDEQESFIDPTADIYNAPPAIRNPFDDNNRIQKQYHKNRTDAGYDSFDSLDDGDNDGDEFDSDESGSEYSSEDENRGTRVGNSSNRRYQEASDGDDQEDDEDEEDTQRLLMSSNNTRIGGMGMGMRAGETGTGTMLGLDLEPRGDQQDDDYDTLPMSTVDVERIRMNDQANGKNVDGTGKPGAKKTKRRKRKGSKRKQSRESTGSQPVLGLGAIRAEQVAAIAKRRFRVQMAWNAFYVFVW